MEARRSEIPQTGSSSLKLFQMAHCPFAQRVHAALVEKELPFDIIVPEGFPHKKPQDLQEHAPYGKSPTLQDPSGIDRWIWGSSTIMEFLEEEFPSSPHLMPENPIEKARVRMWLDFCDNEFVPTIMGFMKNEDKSKEQELLVKVEHVLQRLEDSLKVTSQSGPFLLGGIIMTIADIAFAPFLDRFNAFTSRHKEEVLLDFKFPRIKAWMEAIFATRAYRESKKDASDQSSITAAAKFSTF